MNINSSFSHRNKEPESGVLYIVGTPIGNLSDISERAINILKNVFLIACEDTRETRKIITRFKIKNTLISFNEHNYSEKIPKIINYLKSGKSIAIVSDAGMPGICDPGEELISKARNQGFDVICIPGPCAALVALVSSGLPSSKFVFEGFLPKKKSERDLILYEISKSEKTTILFESPHRLKKLLKDLKKYCGGSKEIELARELTKKYEEHIGSNIDAVIKYYESKNPIGEFTIVIKGEIKFKNENFDKLNIKRELQELINAGLSLSAASKYLAKRDNLTKKVVYNLHKEF